MAGGLRTGRPASARPARALPLVRFPRRRASGRRRAWLGHTSPLQSPQYFGYDAPTNTISWGSRRAALFLGRACAYRKLGRETMLLAENPKILYSLGHHTQSIGVIAMGKCGRARRGGDQKLGAAENEPEGALGRVERRLDGRYVGRRPLERDAHGLPGRCPAGVVSLGAAAGSGSRCPSGRRPSSISRRRNRRSFG